MESDFGSGLSQKSAPKRGRRSKLPTAAKESIDDTIGTDADNTQTVDAPPRPSRRQMGWDKSITSDPFDARLAQDANKLSDEDDDDIQVIPDLDEIHEDDIAQEVAAPPSSFTSKIASYGELDMDLMNRSAFRTLDGDIDLKVLVRNLTSEQEVKEEEDVLWQWDRLFADISASLKPKHDVAVDEPPSEEREV